MQTRLWGTEVQCIVILLFNNIPTVQMMKHLSGSETFQKTVHNLHKQLKVVKMMWSRIFRLVQHYSMGVKLGSRPKGRRKNWIPSRTSASEKSSGFTGNHLSPMRGYWNWQRLRESLVMCWGNIQLLTLLLPWVGGQKEGEEKDGQKHLTCLRCIATCSWEFITV